MGNSSMIPNRNPARRGEGRTSFTLEDDQAADLRELMLLYAKHLRISRLLLKDAFAMAISHELKRMKEMLKK